MEGRWLCTSQGPGLGCVCARVAEPGAHPASPLLTHGALFPGRAGPGAGWTRTWALASHFLALPMAPCPAPLRCLGVSIGGMDGPHGQGPWASHSLLLQVGDWPVTTHPPQLPLPPDLFPQGDPTLASHQPSHSSRMPSREGIPLPTSGSHRLLGGGDLRHRWSRQAWQK